MATNIYLSLEFDVANRANLVLEEFHDLAVSLGKTTGNLPC